jgi:hypothetical protein
LIRALHRSPAAAMRAGLFYVSDHAVSKTIQHKLRY